MRVNTTDYEWTTGRKPRGYGHWAFEICGETYFFTGTYGAAKKQAIAKARELCALTVSVLG